MINSTLLLIDAFCDKLKEGYRQMYEGLKPEYQSIIAWVGRMALETITNSDALYHNVEHTALVTLVGQEILRGKHMCEGGVSPEDWLLLMVSLCCHDIGFVKSVCRQDRGVAHTYAIGRNGGTVVLPAGSSDASLNPYHVDRGKLFIEERFGGHKLIDPEVVKHNIELTRFPVPAAEDHQDTVSSPGLVRAADLIGQLSDPRYLKKVCALFYEFEETGVNKILGYRNPGDLRKNYPKFYWQAVYPYVKDALGYLTLTTEGKQIAANLYANVFVVEHEQTVDDRAQLTGAKEATHQGKPTAYWVQALKSGDRYERMYAATVLGEIRADARETVPPLTEALLDKDESIRQWAAHALEQIGPNARSAVPALGRALYDVNAFVRLKAAEALWKIDRKVDAVMPTMQKALEDDSWLVRSAAALALGKIGPEARSAAPFLSLVLQDSSNDVRKTAAAALRTIAPEALVPALAEALRSQDRYVRMQAAFSLGELGPEAMPTLNALLAGLRDASWMVRRVTALALGQIGSKDGLAVGALVESLKDDSELVREAAAEALGFLGPQAREAVPALLEAITDKDGNVGKASAEALKKVEHGATAT